LSEFRVDGFTVRFTVSWGSAPEDEEQEKGVADVTLVT
jgi:hypothetical protein